ncbi:MAG: cysteine-rich CWC family protein [Niabella sp.]
MKQKHENKTCPGCGQVFECKVGDVLKCQCFGINFTEEQQDKIARQFRDCLCRNCLQQLKNQYQQAHEEPTP